MVVRNDGATFTVLLINGMHGLRGRPTRRLHVAFARTGDFVLETNFSDDQGLTWSPPGAYFVRLEAEGRTLARRFVWLH